MTSIPNSIPNWQTGDYYAVSMNFVTATDQYTHSKKSLAHYTIPRSHSFFVLPSIFFVHYFKRLSFKLSYLFWKPWCNKWHLKRVTVRMKCVEWFRWYCTQHWENAPRKLITNCNVKNEKNSIQKCNSNVLEKIVTKYARRTIEYTEILNRLRWTKAMIGKKLPKVNQIKMPE